MMVFVKTGSGQTRTYREKNLEEEEQKGQGSLNLELWIGKLANSVLRTGRFVTSEPTGQGEAQ